MEAKSCVELLVVKSLISLAKRDVKMEKMKQNYMKQKMKLAALKGSMLSFSRKNYT
jgi:hypothetical protein